MDDTQLRWLHYNRSRPGHRPPPPVQTDRTERRDAFEKRRRGSSMPLGGLLREVLERGKKLSGPAQRAWEVLESHGGATLVEQIDSVTVRGGALVVDVAEPAVRYHIRITWQQRILEWIQAELPGLGINEIRFPVTRRQ